MMRRGSMRRVKAYRAVVYRCPRCQKTKRTATALDGLRCRETKDCEGRYERSR